MSMPKFSRPCKILTREAAINAILTSIAMEESALQAILSESASAAALVEVVTDAQIVLKNKMVFTASALPFTRIEEIAVASGQRWSGSTSLKFAEKNYIALPKDTEYKIGINLKFQNKSLYPVLIEARIIRRDELIVRRRYSYEDEENIHIEDEIKLAAQAKECKLLLRLVTLNKLDIKSGIISIKK